MLLQPPVIQKIIQCWKESFQNVKVLLQKALFKDILTKTKTFCLVMEKSYNTVHSLDLCKSGRIWTTSFRETFELKLKKYWHYRFKKL